MAPHGGHRDELLDDGAQRIRAEKPGLRLAARMQQTIGENMPTLRMRSELDLIDSEEIDRPVERHRLDRANPKTRPRWNALFLPGHEGDVELPDARRDPIVDFTREQAQGQTDHSGAVLEHALHGTMGLAGVGRAEQSHDLSGAFR